MEYYAKNGNIYLRQSDFDLDQTLDCGQAFRWKKISPDAYRGFFVNTPLTISQNGDEFVLFDTSEEVFLKVWAEYFDLYTDYGQLKKRFSHDETLKKACEFAGGIRLLKQDSWEALCSFIISQNNNIPRIKGIISRLCEHYGGFPTFEQISRESVESLGFLRAGFRAKYIIDASQKLSSGSIYLDEVKKMPIDEARKVLMTIKGVGAKVSECALLYGMYRTEAFPVDVWIKRVLEKYYPNGLPDCIKGVEGIAQQFLFHFIRNNP